MNVIVLAGGISTERDVSLSSGKMIYQALKKLGHRAVLLDVYLGCPCETVNGIFDRETDWAKSIGSIGSENPDLDSIRRLRPDGDRNFFGPNVITLCQEADVVFMALHGANGEDGKIQACFDLMGITYTGTDFVSSALSMDKGLSKELFEFHQIPTPKGIRLKCGEQLPKGLPYPMVVKVCNGGSSVGVYIVENEDDCRKSLEEAYQYDSEVIIEQYIKGREFSVGVMDGRALPVIEIAPVTGFYDYKNKYQEGSAVETCPAELSPAKTAEMQETAEKVFRILRLKNYARMDFMMNERDEIFCLEANTLPGMTPTSLLPQEAKAIGMDFESLCQNIIDSAMGSKGSCKKDS